MKTFNKACNFKISKEATIDNNQALKVSGYASTYNEDHVGDVMVRGCFQKSLEKNKGRFFILANHNQSDPIGVATKAVELEHGLFINFDIWKIPSNEKHINVIHKAMEYGLEMGLSVGGKVIDADLKTKSKGIEIKEFDLMEVSICALPCNAQARIESVKSLINTFKNKTDDGNQVIQYLLKREFYNGN